MVFKVRFSSIAEYDLHNIFLYLESNWADKIVDTFSVRLDQLISEIEKHPNSYPFYSEEWQVRKCSLRPHYGIFFKILNDEVFILTIFDFRTDPQKLASFVK